MASNKGNGRERGPGRRNGEARRRTLLQLESLEGRTLLDGGGVPRPWLTSNLISDAQNGPMANAGPVLIKAYQEYQSYLGTGQSGDFARSPLNTQRDSYRFDGDRVGIDVVVVGDLRTALGDLSTAGMKIEVVADAAKMVEGLVPINNLPQISAVPVVVNVSPITRMYLDQQGVANNQAEQALFVDVARQQYLVNGAGVRVGVISDSANQTPNTSYPGTPNPRQPGIGGSVQTGDLPPNTVILQDGPAGSSDEGRAMMEQIYDLAPGAQLYFATAAGGPLNFANNIRALATAGSKVIVDDIFYGGIPFYQDGVIAQAVKDVVRNNDVVYVSSAGNAGDHGYDSPVFGTRTTTIGGTTGRFVDFDPSGAILNQMPITVTGTTLIEFQFDQAFNQATSNVTIIFYDANGVVVAQGGANTQATQLPLQQVVVPATARSFSVRVIAGSDIGRFRIREFGTQSDFNVSKQFGNQGGIAYPTSFGHKVVSEMVGTGAVPWFNAPPVGNQNPLRNEDFSSFGPVTILFDPQGMTLPAPERRLKPDMSATDANNTSFFGALGGIPPGIASNNYNLPNFFGTSSAAPNLAAVAALMRQLSPNSTNAEIRSGLQVSAVNSPLNPNLPYAPKIQTPDGTWDPQGGYGLINAVRALAQVDVLRVNMITPANGQVLNALPNLITVTYSYPVNPASIDPTDIQVTGPAGTTTVVGTPVIDPINTNVVRYPVMVDFGPGTVANGTYRVAIPAGGVTALNGKVLSGSNSNPALASSTTFNVQDVLAPTILNTRFQGRYVTVQFSEAMRPSTVNRSTILLERDGLLINSDPRLSVIYDATTFTGIIDLTNVPQFLLTSGNYKLTVTDSATDMVGNKLDGEFFPFKTTFPSGNGQAGTNFVQLRSNVVLQAPLFAGLTLDPTSDTGIPLDGNTRQVKPSFVGRVSGQFPAASAGLQVQLQFNGSPNHYGILDLGVGFGGRGFVGTPDLTVTTDANGEFRFTSPFDALPDGFQIIRAVVVGDSDAPPLPGLSREFNANFRIDTTSPNVVSVNPANETNLPKLTTVTLNIIDPVLPSGLADPLRVPTSVTFPALDPATVSNVSNYRLINGGADGVLGTVDDLNLSSSIVAAQFLPGPNRPTTASPYTGQIQLSFAAGLPAGRYLLTVLTAGVVNPALGVRDAAGNLLDGDTATPGIQNFDVVYNLQPTPTFVTGVQTLSVNNNVPGGVSFNNRIGQYFELTTPGVTPRAEAAPYSFYIDFSNPLPDRDYTTTVQLLRSADSISAASDGEFGTGNGLGFSAIPNVTVRLFDPLTNLFQGQVGFQQGTRLVVSLPPDYVLPADHYRLALANTGTNRIFDIYGNLLDGEFLGNITPDATGYQTLLPNGAIRSGLSGDGLPGGTFQVGYLVVPNGNVIFARPDAQDNPYVPNGNPDGSLDKPYASLAPEGNPAYTFIGGPFAGQPDLNSIQNFGAGFNPIFDRNNNGTFQQSALFAAQIASARGPVVVVALPSQTDPAQTFVLAPGQGTSGVQRDGSASVPFNTMLVFNPGSVLKLREAALYVQNQGTALQLRGGANPGEEVNITSLSDDSVGGDTNNDGAATSPVGGDWGGLVLRNFDQRNVGTPASLTFPIDVLLKGPLDPVSSQFTQAIAGVDEALAILDHATIRFGGAPVPATNPIRYDAISLYNTRAQISNDLITDTGNPTAGQSQAPISGDFDSFRQDDLYRGPIIRQTQVARNSLNGIYVRAELDGVVRQTNAQLFPDGNPSDGGSRNFSFFAPLPYLLTARMEIGSQYTQGGGGVFTRVNNRVYFSPGTLFKFQRGAGIDILNNTAPTTDPRVQPSIVVGDRTYVRNFDLDPSYGPLLANGAPNPLFQAPTDADAQVLFTSLFDDAATTFYFDRQTQRTTTIVAPVQSTGIPSVFPPPQGPGGALDPFRWGGIQISSGAIGFMNSTRIRYAGGLNNPTTGTTIRPALSLLGGNGLGSHTYLSNNNFSDNFDAALTITPNGLLAADPLRPLQSGNPFFRGNVFERNGVNALEVLGFTPGFPPDYSVNLSVNSVWDDTDITYAVRGSIVVANPTRPLPPGTNPGSPLVTNLQAQPLPGASMTIQSTLPDTILADGTTVARPGERAIVKLLGSAAPGDGVNGSSSPVNFGAGFGVGVDPGPSQDAPTNIGPRPPGTGQIRIVGIGGNETTGQQRVPVQITSLRDDSVGRKVRGIDQFGALAGNAIAPAAGDGGLIYFGGNLLTDFNPWDPRDGSIIDNVDIRYMTRIEVQGGGSIDAVDLNGDGGFTAADNPPLQKGGSPIFNALGPNGLQYNASKAMTISNSNLSTFRDVGVLVHPGFDLMVRSAVTTGAGGGFSFPTPARIGGIHGQPAQVFLLQNVITNMPVGARLNAEIQTDNAGGESNQLVMLNNTMWSNQIHVHVEGAIGNAAPAQLLAMNNIFSNPTTLANTIAIRATGGAPGWAGSQLQYNLFDSNAQDVVGGLPNAQPIFGAASFIDPANGNFSLRPDSAAIDASRSELTSFYGTIFPVNTQFAPGQIVLSVPTRTAVNRNSGTGSPTNILTLPGYPIRQFLDQWLPVLPSASNAFPTVNTPGLATGLNTTAPIVYSYTTIGGERDALGFIRLDDASRPNIGFGSRPFFDLGAVEFRRFDAPKVTSVTAQLTVPPPRNLYQVNGIGGINASPQAINVTLTGRLDPATVNGSTVILIAAGLDQILGTNDDTTINLSGKLAYDPSTSTLTINIGAAGLTLTNDLYQLTLIGTGANVIRNTQGIALDGENLGQTQPLPSGDGFPGGNFVMAFTINTSTPAIVPGTFTMDPATDTNVNTDRITTNTTPAFVGQITDVFPPTNPLINQLVQVFVSPNGDGVYGATPAGSGVTDAQGRFRVLLTTPLPNSPRNVGPDGILGTADDLGFSLARVVVTNTSGNQSQPSPTGADIVKFWIDTVPPLINSISPANGDLVQAQTGPNGRFLPVTIQFNENISVGSLSTGIVVTRSGGDGIFGNANDVVLAVDPNASTVTYLFTPGGAEQVTFNIVDPTGTGLPNDLYRLVVRGTGASPVIDVAGNGVDGANTGSPSNLTNTFTVYDPTLVRRFFVDAGNTGAIPDGSRANPYRSIQAAINAAGIGDVVAVLPPSGSLSGPPPRDYTESLILKSQVQLISADPTSTDIQLVRGNALNTVIRAADSLAPITIEGTDLVSSPGLDTLISGFTIAAPLIGNQANGLLNVNSIGLKLTNSDIVVQNSYFITAGTAIQAIASGAGAAGPRILSNVIAGNVVGVSVVDQGVTSYRTGQSTAIYNNDFAFNTFGVTVNVGTQLTADIANNIFAFNNDRTVARNGAAIQATAPNQTLVRYNLFFDNGPSATSNADDVVGVGGGFNPSSLGTVPDPLGNFVGNPRFVNARDPRPNFDGPGFFYTDANFKVKDGSPAIDNSLNSLAPATDFLGAGRVNIPNQGLVGRGPADLGAFEFGGTGGSPIGGLFRVETSSISKDGAQKAGGAVLGTVSKGSPREIVITFSRNVNRASVTASDLSLTGPGVDPGNPARAVSVTWVNDHTAIFRLTGKFVSGPVTVSIPPGTVTDLYGTPVASFSDSFRLTPNGTPAPTPSPGPGPKVDRKSPFVVGAVRVNGNLVVTFSERLKPATARRLSGYNLLAGRTAARGRVRFDRAVKLGSARYDDASKTVTLRLKSGNLPSGPLKLTVRGNGDLRDLAGNVLDGNRDGRSGGDYSTRVN